MPAVSSWGITLARDVISVPITWVILPISVGADFATPCTRDTMISAPPDMIAGRFAVMTSSNFPTSSAPFAIRSGILDTMPSARPFMTSGPLVIARLIILSICVPNCSYSRPRPASAAPIRAAGSRAFIAMPIMVTRPFIISPPTVVTAPPTWPRAPPTLETTWPIAVSLANASHIPLAAVLTSPAMPFALSMTSFTGPSISAIFLLTVAGRLPILSATAPMPLTQFCQVSLDRTPFATFTAAIAPNAAPTSFTCGGNPLNRPPTASRAPPRPPLSKADITLSIFAFRPSPSKLSTFSIIPSMQSIALSWSSSKDGISLFVIVSCSPSMAWSAVLYSVARSMKASDVPTFSIAAKKSFVAISPAWTAVTISDVLMPISLATAAIPAGVCSSISLKSCHATVGFAAICTPCCDSVFIACAGFSAAAAIPPKALTRLSALLIPTASNCAYVVAMSDAL